MITILIMSAVVSNDMSILPGGVQEEVANARRAVRRDIVVTDIIVPDVTMTRVT